MDTGTIYPDGRISLDGCVPEKWRMLAINAHVLVIHSPGGVWYDNSGRNYGAASIEVRELAELRPGNEEGTWRFRLRRVGGVFARFHPTPKTACQAAAGVLRNEGEDIAGRISDKSS